MTVWDYLIFAAMLYCALQAAQEFRRKNYPMAIFGAALVIALLFRPRF